MTEPRRALAPFAGTAVQFRRFGCDYDPDSHLWSSSPGLPWLDPVIATSAAAHLGRWSCRAMARAAGISPASVQRLWAASEIKPHLSRTFKLSNDKRFDEKFWDVIGLYLNPPEKALVLCCDEKSQCQALERTQPVCRWGSATFAPRLTITCDMARWPCLPAQLP
jgi:hypothetical protein